MNNYEKTISFVEKAKSVHNDKYDYSKVEYINSKTKVCIICNEHGEFWQRMDSHLNGCGCPKCAIDNSTLTLDDFIKKAIEIHGDKYDYSKVEYKNTETKVCIICPEHGEFWQKPNNHLHGQGCPKCGREKSQKNRSFIRQDFINICNNVHHNFYDYSKVDYVNNMSKVCIICPEHGEFWQRASSHLHGQGCPLCAKRDASIKRTLTTEDFIAKAKQIHGSKYDYSKVEYKGNKSRVSIICPKHGEFLQIPNGHLNGQGCPKCGNNNESKGEKTLCSFLDKCNLQFVNKERITIYPQELDIYSVKQNIAVEYNGLYWHSEEYKDTNYHLNKTELCEKQGIRLIHIFEDEWLYKQEIVKSRLKSILGIIDNKIYARQCIIKEVSFKESNEFLEKNHIQGNCMSKYRYGLYYNNELVSLMTFGAKRKSLGSKSEEGCYELLRFCNKLNTNVVGGASKLLKHFIKTHNPKEIISYCDRRWSQGQLYEKLGFKFDHVSKPNYFYVINGKRENRFKYRKSELIKQGFDKNKTEHEIMLGRKIYRIYDCGTILYKLNYLS